MLVSAIIRLEAGKLKYKVQIGTAVCISCGEGVLMCALDRDDESLGEMRMGICRVHA
jgi:hypothetical protein